VRLLTFLILLWLLCGSAMAASPDTMHTIFREDEDAVSAAHSTKTRFEGFYKGTSQDPYIIDVDFEQMQGNNGGFIVFREMDVENFYQLNINATSVQLQNKINGIYYVVASAAGGYGQQGTEYLLRLQMADNTFTVSDRNTGKQLIQWTDPANRHPVGYNVSYYAKPGSEVCWTKVNAHPSSQEPFVHAWDLPGVGNVEGYLAPQDKTGNPDIGSARYDATFDNYSTSVRGYGQFNQLQGGQGGNMEYAFEATDYGAAFAYRANLPQSTHIPTNGYELRQTAAETQWGTLDGAGAFTKLATGPPVPPGTRIRIVVIGSVHTVLTQAGEVLIPPQTSSTFNGIRAAWGYTSGDGVIQGYQLVLP
jgi:hypothetical protein